MVSKKLLIRCMYLLVESLFQVIQIQLLVNLRKKTSSRVNIMEASRKRERGGGGVLRSLFTFISSTFSNTVSLTCSMTIQKNMHGLGRV